MSGVVKKKKGDYQNGNFFHGADNRCFPVGNAGYVSPCCPGFDLGGAQGYQNYKP